MVQIHNEALRARIRPAYSAEAIGEITGLLIGQGALDFASLDNGLFPASVGADAEAGGYHYVWVRDNIQIAYAHLLNERGSEAIANLRSLTHYFSRHCSRFADIIDGRAGPSNPMNRPHVRFGGAALEEIPQKWAHAQNDALGYYLWMLCRMMRAGLFEPDEERVDVIGHFVAYFRSIRFWQDEDSGHWEEARKIEASSIGVVTAALRELRGAITANGNLRKLAEAAERSVTIDAVEELIDRGAAALGEILPNECIQTEGRRYRECDGAQLFLIYPTAAVGGAQADGIITRVIGRLQGEYGIRRYRGDSYWCADYKDMLGVGERTKDFSDEIERRDALLRPGEEAQWCIFDPILSSIYGQRYIESRDKDDLERQILYLNRSLGQVTPDFRCPEAYYLEHGRYVPNDNTPLLWAQANLWVALHHAGESLKLLSSSARSTD